MTCGIYRITNNQTGEMYIGQSICIETRFKQHSYGQDKNSAIDNDIRKMGKDNFNFEILLECSKDKLDSNEIKLIEKYDTFHNGYNKTRGGDKFDNPTKYWSNVKKLKRGVEYSKNKTTTGIFRVSKSGNGYSYLYKENGKRKGLYGADLVKLKDKVINKGLKWFIVNVELAEKTFEENRKEIDKKDTTGYFRVRKVKQRGKYVYRYIWKSNGKRHTYQSIDIFTLKQKVIGHGLLWKITNPEKALKTNEECSLILVPKQYQSSLEVFV